MGTGHPCGAEMASPADPTPAASDAMSRSRFSQSVRPLLVVLAMAGVVVVVGVLLARPVALTLAASCLRGRLNTVSDGGAELVVASAARLGTAGIPVLVEALGSKRESVARAGEKTLRREITGWETLPLEQAVPKLSTLADSLARHVDGFGPTARLEAATLCRRILRWPLERAGTARGQLVDHCQTVLRATTLERGLAADGRLADSVQRVALGGPAPGEKTPVARTSPRGGTQEEAQPLGIPPLTREDHVYARIGNPLAVEQAVGGPLSQPSQAAPRRHDVGPNQARSLAMQRAALGPQAAAADDNGVSARRAGVPAEPADASPGGAAASSASADVSTIELMRRLHAADRWEAATAETALKRRGFDQQSIGLARALYDPDPAVRRELAQRLPEIEGVHPTAWLLRLAEDDDPGVRLTAMTLLATTGDARVVEKIERMARQDHDPSVRRQAERLAGRRR